MRRYRKSQGFSLIEVLVSMAIVAVGLLGLAGIQAMIVSNTSTARVRSIAAILAENLSGAIGTNEGYWGVSSVPATIGVAGVVSTSTCDSTWSTTVLTGDATLIGKTTNCNTSACSDGTTIAAYDLRYWGCQLATQLPSGTGKVVCATTASGPVVCTITVSWLEKNMAHKQSTASTAATAQSYEMVVQP